MSSLFFNKGDIMLSGISRSMPSIGFAPMSPPKKAAMVTLLAIAALSYIQKAEAGPLAYSQCVVASGASPFGILACLPLLLVPGP